MIKITLSWAFTFAALFASNSINAQAPQWDWAKQSGGTSTENFGAITADNQGNIYNVGSFYSNSMAFGSITLTNNGPGGDNPTRDGFFTKYDSNGNVLWAKIIGGAQHDEVYAVTTDAQNNVYIAGSFASPTLTFDNITLTNTNDKNDMFIVKYNSNGNAIWAINAEGQDYDYVKTLVVDATGNIYAAGSFSSPVLTLAEGINLYNTQGSITHNVFIAKYNSEGVALWAKSAGGDSFEESIQVSLDNNGNVYYMGYYFSASLVFGNYTLNNTNDYGDIFIVKLENDGDVIWAKTYGNVDYEYPRNMVHDNNGYFYIGGYYQSPTFTLGSTTLTNSGTYGDIFLAKFSEDNGNPIWAKTASGDRSDQINSVLIDQENNIYTIGSFATFGVGNESITFPGTTTIQSAGKGDVFIAKYNSDGNLQWVKKTGGTGNDLGLGGCIHNNYLYMGGLTSSPTLSFDNTSISQIGYEDICLGRIQLGILGTEEFEMNKSFLYPNPTKGLIYITGITDNDTMYTINDITGKIVKKGELTYAPLDVSNLSPGLYILNTNSGINTKFIKE